MLLDVRKRVWRGERRRCLSVEGCFGNTAYKTVPRTPAERVKTTAEPGALRLHATKICRGDSVRGIMIAYARVDVGVRAGASHADGNIRTERVFCLEECGCVEAVRVHTGWDGGE